MARLDRRPREHQPTATQRPPLTAAAKRSRRLRHRRKAGIRCLVIEISEPDLQCLAKVAPQADPAVERTIRAVLSALPRNTGDWAHRATEQSGQVSREYEVCAHCGDAGRVGYGRGDLLPAEIGGEHFVVHSRCFEALAAARNRP
jgi:hypothetical protein